MAIQSFQEAQERDFMPFSVYIGEQQYNGYFANIRVDRRTLPDGWHAYDIRDDDSNGEPCQIVNGYVKVNHFGTFCTQTPLPLEDGEGRCRNGEPDDEFDYSFR